MVPTQSKKLELVNRNVETLEEDTEIKILDSGYLKFVEHWGSDKRVVEAARMSTDKGFLGWGPIQCDVCIAPDLGITCQKCKGKGYLAGDEKLLHYLYSKKHATPFEMAGMVIEIKAPIAVFREWHRHRTQSYNEMSARYTPLPNDNYVPTVERCLIVSGTNKQAGKIKDCDELTHETALEWLTELEGGYEITERIYQSGLKKGIPKELARLIVPVGRYSKMRASANLRNWLAFLTLRMAEDAQYEIRMFANEVGRFVEALFPRTWELFQLGRNGQL